MGDSTNESKRYRVILLPWLAYSHISQFLAFAKGLAKHSCFDIYLCSSQINLQIIKKNLPDKYSQSAITLVELNLPSSTSLPLHYHTTNGLPPHLLKTLTADYANSFPDFEIIIQNIRPHLLIYDHSSQLWAIDAATSMNIPGVMFLNGCVSLYSMGAHFAKKPSGEKYPFPEMYFKDHEIAHMKAIGRYIPPPTGEIKTTSHPFFECMNRSRDIILVKSTRELAGKYIDYMSEVVGKKVLPVGPLVEENSKEDVNEHVELFQWLDKKEDSSVVFVSFGSEYFLSDNDIEDIAYGLELSQVSFIWVIRSPEGVKTSSVEQVLPHGFLERLGDRGIVTDKWLPQAKILSHSSTGGFISHCGWGSVMESFHYGVPVIAMPMQFDQPFNARLVETLEVGIDVSRDGDGRLKREEMAEVLRKVVVEDSGASIRKNAKELGEIMRNKMEEGVDKEVIQNLIKLCELNN